MPKDPESLGTGIGTRLADYIPLLPSGARRAGAARVMAARIGEDPSVLVHHPLKMQLLALGLGAGGHALTKGEHPGKRLAATLGPIALVQALRRHEIKGIQKRYDDEDRKRLRELDQDDLFDDGILGLGGSARLGAVQAYETMRKRKYRSLGSLAEAGDALQLTANSFGPAVAAGAIPLVSGIDKREAALMLKKSDFTDQREIPSLPLYLAAGALGSAGLAGAGMWAKSEMADTPQLGTDKWRDTIGTIAGTSPRLYATEGHNNAFFYKPRTEQEAVQFLNYARGMRDLNESPESLSRVAEIKQLLRHGTVVADRDAGAPVIAHEAGHAKIEETPGIMRMLQRHLYPHSRWIAPVSSAGSMAAGLASGSALKGALLGTGIGAISGVGMLGPEAGASYHAIKHLNGGGESKKDLMAALSTYLAAGVLPSTLSGAAGGWIAGRRKKKEREKRANVEQAVKLWKALNHAKKLKSQMGSNAADRYLMGNVGSVYRAARGRFFNNPSIAGAGLTSRSRPATIEKALAQLQSTPPKLEQGTLNLGKYS